MIYRYVLPSLLICAGALIIVSPLRANDSSDRQAKLNGGYYLLYKLAGDEAQLPLLLDVKHAPPELVSYADEISKMGKETEGALEHMEESSPSIKLDRNPLPPIEEDVRDSIKGDKQHQLLFGTSDSEFVRALLVSQIEASTYGTHLCKVLADQELNPDRANKFRKLSTGWQKKRDEAYRLLRNY